MLRAPSGGHGVPPQNGPLVHHVVLRRGCRRETTRTHAGTMAKGVAVAFRPLMPRRVWERDEEKTRLPDTQTFRPAFPADISYTDGSGPASQISQFQGPLCEVRWIT